MSLGSRISATKTNLSLRLPRFLSLFRTSFKRLTGLDWLTSQNVFLKLPLKMLLLLLSRPQLYSWIAGNASYERISVYNCLQNNKRRLFFSSEKTAFSYRRTASQRGAASQSANINYRWNRWQTSSRHGKRQAQAHISFFFLFPYPSAKMANFEKWRENLIRLCHASRQTTNESLIPLCCKNAFIVRQLCSYVRTASFKLLCMYVRTHVLETYRST